MFLLRWYYRSKYLKVFKKYFKYLWKVFAFEENKTICKQCFSNIAAQSVKPKMPIFNRVQGNPPLHLVWTFGSNPSSRSKDRALTNILKKEEKENRRSAKQYLPDSNNNQPQ